MLDDVIIKYLGCIGIKTSMRSLSPRTRSEVAKESINRLCRANNIRRSDSISMEQDYIEHMLDEEPNLTHSGSQVKLIVTTTHLNVLEKGSNVMLIQHEMPNVSFASSGDDDTVDFVAYVAKNAEFKRACFVLECGYKSGKRVLESIAHGFQLRTHQILYNGNTSKKSPTLSQDSFNNVFQTADFHESPLDTSYRVEDENNQDEALIAQTRASLEREPWFHGSYLSREESETRLKQDGDFLVRESMLDPGHFVLSVMNDGSKLHLLFDTIGQVRTRDMVFDNISKLISYHHSTNTPIIANNRIICLRVGVRPTPRSQ